MSSSHFCNISSGSTVDVCSHGTVLTLLLLVFLKKMFLKDMRQSHINSLSTYSHTPTEVNACYKA